MTLEVVKPGKEQSGFGRVVYFMFSLFLRLLALVAFLATLYIWTKLIGYWDGANNRFDTMPMTLRIYALVLSVVLPVACVGLWTTLAWGRVIWFLLIAFQIVFIIRYVDVVEHAQMLVLFHSVTLGIYVLFQILLFFIDKKE